MSILRGKKNIIRKISVVILFGLICSFKPLLVSAAEKSLSSEAEQVFKRAMTRGLVAAAQKEWELAIKYFTKAQEAAPTSPRALFNLALAYDRLGSHELIAIAWYNAYLTVLPDAANAGQVKKRLLELEIKVEANIGKLIRKAIMMIAQLPKETSKYKWYDAIAKLQAMMGDIAEARKTAARITSAYWKYRAYTEIARAQLKSGDIVSARDSLARAKASAARITTGLKSSAYTVIAELQVKAGDIAGARETVARITDGSYKSEAYIGIARAQIKAGDIAGASKTAARITDGYLKSRAYIGIARAQIKAGDIAGARDSLAWAKASAAHITGDYYKSSAYTEIAEAQVKVGDIAGARKTAAHITNDYHKSLAYIRIARAQVKVGDIAGARETAARITDDYYKSMAYIEIAEAQLKAGDKAGARKSSAFALELAANISGHQYHRKIVLKRILKRIEASAKQVGDENMIGRIAKAKKQADVEGAIKPWTGFANKALKKPVLVDLPGVIQSLANKQPNEAVESLAEGAREMANALAELRKIRAEEEKRQAAN